MPGSRPEEVPEWASGLFEADGRKVMVVSFYSPSFDHPLWRYGCRIAKQGQRSRDGIVSADTRIVAYTIVVFRQYELSAEPVEALE